MIQFGPGDYSLSLGYPRGQRNYPKVKEAELNTIKTALKKRYPSPSRNRLY
jgi:hypothetical protein